MESDELKDRITGEVVELRSRAEFAVEQVSIATRNVAAARRLQELTQGRREFGIGAILEAVDAERELARARTEHLRAIANHNGCQWEFWYVIGQDDAGSPAAAAP
jgi:outer membrane protein TolC